MKSVGSGFVEYWRREEGIRQRIQLPLLVAICFFNVNHSAAASLDCSKPERAIEKLICDDEEIHELNDRMSELYNSARGDGDTPRNQVLETSQRVWSEQRDKCNGAELRKCVIKQYNKRILVLEVVYEQGDGSETLTYRCDDLKNDVKVTFFKTVPPAVRLSVSKGDDVVVAEMQPSDKGERYVASDGRVWAMIGSEVSLTVSEGKTVRCHLK